jgi:hypothetical protein
MRKARLFLSVPLAAAAVGIFALPATASSPSGGLNYGHCVSSGAVSPRSSVVGPGFLSDHTPSGNTGAANATVQSHEQSRFLGSQICAAGIC